MMFSGLSVRKRCSNAKLRAQLESCRSLKVHHSLQCHIRIKKQFKVLKLKALETKPNIPVGRSG
jgi:hypothetical protein